MFVCLIGSSEMSQVLLLFLRDAYCLFTLPQILWSWLSNQLLRCLDKMMNPKKLSSSWWFHLRYDYWPRCQWWWRQQVGVLYKSPVPGNHNTIPILQPNFLLFSRCRFDMPGCSGSCFRRKEKNLPAHRQVSDFYSHGKRTPQRDADCLWRSPFGRDNSVSVNNGPGTVSRLSDDMNIWEEMIQEGGSDCRNDTSLTRNLS